MGVFSMLFANRIYNYEEAFGAIDCTSDLMKTAIQDWYDLYFNRYENESEDPSQRLAYTIVNKLTKTVFSEYKSSASNDFGKKIISALDLKRKKAMQHALIAGECYLKPIPYGDTFFFTVVGRNNVLVFGRDIDGNPIDIGTTETTKTSEYYYNLLERRTIGQDGKLTIKNDLYRSDSKDYLGIWVPLKTLEKYENLPDIYTSPTPINSLGLVPIRTPMENCVDGGMDAVSVYAAAAGLIHLININEHQINGEFERGESRIITSDDLLKKGRSGRRQLKDHIFVGLDDDIENVGITIFSPAFREQSYLARKKEYLRNIESVIGIKRGLLSEVEAVERTAKEITSSEGDYSLTIIDFQQMWEKAVKDTLVLCGQLGELYKIPGATRIADNQILIDWGNGVLYDKDKERAEIMQWISAGLLKPEIGLAWMLKLPWETPNDLAIIREKYMPEIQELTEGE